MLPFFFFTPSQLARAHTDHKYSLAFVDAFVLSAKVKLFYN